MVLKLITNICYEVLVETSEGTATSEFFTLCNIPQSREQALNRFLELTISDEIKPDEIFVTVYSRYMPTGERIELINTVSHPGETLEALAQELEWYQLENLAVNLAVFDPFKPGIIKIIFPQHRFSGLQKTQNMALLLGSQYWVFLGRKKEVLRYGNVF
jgi:hypothetical protein